MGPDLLHWMSECVPDGGQFLVAEPGALGVPDGDLESTKATVCEAVPTAALAAATAALSVGVGFLPVSGPGPDSALWPPVPPSPSSRPLPRSSSPRPAAPWTPDA
jgi:hypothetical protein